MGLPATLLDALSTRDAANKLRALDEAGELTRLIPELEAGRGFKQPELHFYTVLDHSLAAVAAFDAAIGEGEDGRELRQAMDWIDLDEALGREVEDLPLTTLTRLAALLHDVAKPETAVFADGRLRFPRHGPRGAELMRERLPQLGFGPGATDFVTRLIRYHLRPNELVRSWPPTDRAMRRFVADLDGHVLPLMLLNVADGMATRGPGYTRENFRRHCAFVNYVVARALGAVDEGETPLLTGYDVMRELHLESGRLVGAVLTSVRRAQEAGTVSNRDEAMALARAIVARSKQQGEGPGP
ncbi:MAG: HD domain-containing protein [Dehalococcoidia bacterium]|nr:HD domain-containing protein [Dehalococcoidia bacterium]